MGQAMCYMAQHPRTAKQRGQPLWRSAVDAVDASVYADF